MAAGVIALTIAALFTGAAIYITVAEQPARLQLDIGAALQEWKPSYKAGFAMQASLAVLGAIAGGLQWYFSNELIWLIGALVLLANWPFTVLCILPVNNVLMATQIAAADAHTRTLIARWGRLHFWRAVLGAGSTVIFIWALT